MVKNVVFLEFFNTENLTVWSGAASFDVEELSPSLQEMESRKFFESSSTMQILKYFEDYSKERALYAGNEGVLQDKNNK